MRPERHNAVKVLLFFDIGGDSLRLTQMHSKLEQATGVEFSVTALFQYPTVKAFAQFLHEHHPGEAAGPSITKVIGQPAAEDRAARQRAAMARWR